MAVKAGAKIAMYRISMRSDTIPISGLKIEGSRMKTVNEPANNMESSNLLIRRGRNTARKLEKTSWIKWPPEMMSNLSG